MTDVVGLRFVTEGEQAAIRALEMYRRGLIRTADVQDRHVSTINSAIQREIAAFQNAQRIRERSTQQEIQRLARQTQMMERSQREQERALLQSARTFQNTQKIKQRALQEEQAVQQRAAEISRTWATNLNQSLGITGQRATELGATFTRLNEVQRNLEGSAASWTTTANQNLGVTGQRATELGASFSRLAEVQRNLDAVATQWTSGLNTRLGVTGQRATELGATFARLSEIQRNIDAIATQWTTGLNERLGVTGQRATELGATFTRLAEIQRSIDAAARQWTTDLNARLGVTGQRATELGATFTRLAEVQRNLGVVGRQWTADLNTRLGVTSQRATELGASFSALEERQRRVADQFKQLQASIDPAIAAQQRYAEAERRVNAAVAQGITTKERGNATLAAYRLRLSDLGRTALDTETAAGRLRMQFLATANTIAILDGPLGGIASRFSAFGVLLGRTGIILGALAVSFTAFTATLGRAIGDMARAETALLSLQGVIDATGGATGRAADEVERMTRTLARATLFDREDFRAAARQVLTFGNVVGDTFDRVMSLSGDLAFTFGTQVPAAATQLARALNDPRQNLTALTRSYGLLTREQRNAVVALQEQGRLLEAQALILELVEKRIGGVAAAAGTGLAGAADTAGEAFTDFRQALAEATRAGDAYRSALERVARALDSATANMSNIVAGFRTLRDVVITLAATRIPALVAATFSWSAAALAGATATGILTASVVKLNIAAAFLGGPVGIAAAALAATGLFIVRMREARDPTEQAAQATERYARVLNELIVEKGREAAIDTTKARLEEKNAALDAAEATLALVQARFTAAQSDPYGAFQVGAELEPVLRDVNRLRAEIEGLRDAAGGLGLDVERGVRLSAVAMRQLVRMAQIQREEQERVAEAGANRLRGLQQEVALSRIILQFGEDSVQAEAERLRQGEANLRLALEQEKIYGAVAEQIVAAWREQQSLTREIQASIASANNLANAFSGVGGAIASAQQRMVGLNAQLAAARAGMTPGEAAAMGSVAQVRAAARAEAEAIGGPHAGILPARVQQDLKALEQLELQAARTQEEIANVFRGDAGGGGGGAQQTLITLAEIEAQLLREQQRRIELLQLGEQERAQREIFFRIVDQLDAQGVAYTEAEVARVAERIAAQQRLAEEMERQQQLAQTLGQAFGSLFTAAIDGANSFRQALSGLLRQLASALANAAFRNLLSGGGGGGFLGAISSLGGALLGNANGNAFSGGRVSPYANGGAFYGGNVIPFANGGVVDRPTTFPMRGNQTGLMGEAGPEAIMPLKRGRDGKLGVASQSQHVSVDVRVHMDENGNWKANVESIADRRVRAQAGSIVRQSVQATYAANAERRMP